MEKKGLSLTMDALFSKKNILLLTGMVLILGALAFTTLYLVSSHTAAPLSSSESHRIFAMDLEPLQISLTDKNPDGSPRILGILHIKICIETQSSGTIQYIREFKVRLMDKINAHLSSKKCTDLWDGDSSKLSEKFPSLKKELLSELNRWIPDGHISSVYFSEYFVE